MARFKVRCALRRSRRIRGLAAAFPHLPRSLLGEMADDVHESRFRRGEVIVREGGPGDRFYIIESGQAEGTRSAPEGDVRVVTMEAGEYFGEVGLLATRTRTAKVRAVREVRVISLDRAHFTKYLVGSDGMLIGRWPTKVPPDDPGLVGAIESALPS